MVTSASSIFPRHGVALTLAAGLSIAAAIAIIAILTHSFDRTDAQLIGTSLGFSVFSALGAAGAPARPATEAGGARCPHDRRCRARLCAARVGDLGPRDQLDMARLRSPGGIHSGGLSRKHRAQRPAGERLSNDHEPDSDLSARRLARRDPRRDGDRRIGPPPGIALDRLPAPVRKPITMLPTCPTSIVRPYGALAIFVGSPVARRAR